MGNTLEDIFRRIGYITFAVSLFKYLFNLVITNLCRVKSTMFESVSNISFSKTNIHTFSLNISTVDGAVFCSS